MADPIPPRPGLGALTDRMNAERQRTTRLERPTANARTVADGVQVDVLGTFDWMEPPTPTATLVPLSTGRGIVEGGIRAHLTPGGAGVGTVTASVTAEVRDAARNVVVARGTFVDTLSTRAGAVVELGFSHTITASGPAPYTVTLLISASATGTPGHVAFTAPHLKALTT